MSFRKRNTVLAPPGGPSLTLKSAEKVDLPGTRPSPLDGRLTTSTGTRSLDVLLAGHAGLALGTSLLIEETGTTDFGGALLRYYAAEGLIQGHQVHVLGMDEIWARDLPGLTSTKEEHTTVDDGSSTTGDKMKIAWRYERMGKFERDKGIGQLSPANPNSPAQLAVFCHDFDLSKRLVMPNPSLLKCVPIALQLELASRPTESCKSTFAGFLYHLTTQLSASLPSTVHRVVIPNLLSPAMYQHTASIPEHVLQFLHGLRALLRNYSNQLTALITFPLSLHPRTSGLTRWIELLSDGVLELAPFPSNHAATHVSPITGSSTAEEEAPQGMLKAHRLPIFHEKGGGSGESGELGNDLAFTLSRRRGLVIKSYSLPPIDGDTVSEQGGLEGDHGNASKLDIEF